MNRGDGAKFAAKAKSSFLFKDTVPNKNKKFGYKKKVQTFPIRKVTTTQDSEAENKPAPQKKPVSNKSTSQKSLSTNARVTDSKSGSKAAASSDRDNKQSGQDFVKKNVQKVGRKTKDESKDVNTIALTQDQLNAILKSIGQISGTENIASIVIENGDVKVNSPDKETSPDKSDNSNKDSKHDEKDDGKTKKEDGDKTSAVEGTENILALLAKIPRTPASVSNTTPSKSPKKGSGRKTAEQKQDENDEAAIRRDKNPTHPKEEDIGHQLEFAHLSLAERKRRKWKQELDEQVALKRQQEVQDKRDREVVTNRTREMDTHQQYERRIAPSMNTQQVGDVRTSKDNFSPDTSPRAVAPSSLGVIATQRIVPSAMRSSFLIGGEGSAGSRLSDHNAQVKRRQQQEWLQELERQRVEARERKDRDKQNQRDYESNLTQQWAEPVDLPKTQQATRGQPQVQDDTAVIRQSEREGDRRGEVEQPRSAPPQGAEVGLLTDKFEERSNIRPHNLLLDPAEVERREVQRLKHMEHMLAVKAQVEEKQRLKREANDRRHQEEAEEEQRLSQQRMNLQYQFNSEKDKQRKKEEDEVSRHRALVESMQTAYQQAQQEKQKKKLDKLTKMGHDTSNLRRSWDNQQEVSPRHQQPDPQAAFKASPRTEQPTQPQPVRHSPVAPVPRHVMDHVASHVASHVTEGPIMVDAFTSPVYDQAVQTEFHFLPNEDVSLQGGQLEREPSAHIEYKPDRRPVNGNLVKKEKSNGSQTNKTQERRMRTVEEETQDGKVGATRQTRQTSRASSPGSEQRYTRKKLIGKTEKPVWGASSKAKKLQRNSDKDLTVSKRKREERRKQRAADLLADQERNAPARLAKAKKPKSPVGDTQQGDSILVSKATGSRAGSNLDGHPNHESHRGRTESVRDRADSQPWTDVNSNLPDTPPLKNGDFVPFLRTDEPLMSEDSVPVTPESRQMQRQRRTVKTIIADDSERQRKEDKIRLPEQTEKDPLLNPDRLKDTEQRQERILQQLSHLRHGLMMKQREMELGLNSPVLM